MKGAAKYERSWERKVLYRGEGGLLLLLLFAENEQRTRFVEAGKDIDWAMGHGFIMQGLYGGFIAGRGDNIVREYYSRLHDAGTECAAKFKICSTKRIEVLFFLLQQDCCKPPCLT